MKSSPIQTNFTGGKFSPEMEGHINSPRRDNSYKDSINLIPLVQGPLARRGGTKFVSEIKDSAKRSHLVPFEFNVQQAYMVEWGAGYFRFFKDYGTILSGGVPYEVVSPYSQSDLFSADNLFIPQVTQSADVQYIAHESHVPRALTRTGDASWSLTPLIFEDGPYLPTNRTTTTLTPSGTSGVVTITASSIVGINDDTGFQSTDVGRLIRMQNSTNWYWLTIASYISPTQVTAQVEEVVLPNTNAVSSWRLGLYSETTGWPSVVTIYEGRIALGASPDFRQRVDLSTSGGFSPTRLRFSPTDPDASVNPDNAISISISTTNYIQWLEGDEKGLVVGTAGGEWMIRPSINGEALTPDNCSAKPTSREGCARIQPIATGSTILFAQRYRRKLNEHAYNFEVDGYRAPDLTILSNRILGTGVINMAWQGQPNRMAWCACSDGGLRALTYRREEEIIAWSPYELGGYSDFAQTAPPVVECVACIPSPDESTDDVWMIVRRNINGQDERYIEWMTPRYDSLSMTIEDAFHVDCGLTYDGVPASTFTGLDHLEGQTVAVMVDGRSHPNLTVTGGEVTLANSVTGSKVHIGLPNRWFLRTHKWEAGARDGTAQGKIKRFSHAILRVLDTLGLKYGLNTMDEYVFDNAEGFDETVGLYSGDIKVPWPDGYDRAGELYFEDDGVFPAMIQAIMPRIRTQDS